MLLTLIVDLATGFVIRKGAKYRKILIVIGQYEATNDRNGKINKILADFVDKYEKKMQKDK